MKRTERTLVSNFRYRIPDEPIPSPLAGFAVPPLLLLPLTLFTALAISPVCWLLPAGNALLLGGIHKWREVGLSALALVSFVVGLIGRGVMIDAGLLSGIAESYSLDAIVMLTVIPLLKVLLDQFNTTQFRRAVGARSYAVAAEDASAIEALRDALTENPQLADSHAALAHGLLAARRVVGAEREAWEALRLDPENVDAMKALALIAQLQDRRVRAQARLDYILRIAPGDVEAKILRARFLRLNLAHGEASAAIVEALEAEPDNRAALVEAAWQARDRGDHLSVEAIGRRLLSKDPGDATAMVLLGYAHRDRRERDKATELALAALDCDPGDPEALELMATITVAKNPLAGGMWHALRVLGRLSEGKRILLLSFLFFLYMATLTTFEWFDWPSVLQWLFMAIFVTIGLAAWLVPTLIEWLVTREQREMRLRRGR